MIWMGPCNLGWPDGTISPRISQSGAVAPRDRHVTRSGPMTAISKHLFILIRGGKKISSFFFYWDWIWEGKAWSCWWPSNHKLEPNFDDYQKRIGWRNESRLLLKWQFETLEYAAPKARPMLDFSGKCPNNSFLLLLFKPSELDFLSLAPQCVLTERVHV